MVDSRTRWCARTPGLLRSNDIARIRAGMHRTLHKNRGRTAKETGAVEYKRNLEFVPAGTSAPEGYGRAALVCTRAERSSRSFALIRASFALPVRMSAF